MREFQEAVKMTASEISHWLDGESIGRQSGRSIVEILHKKRADYTADDIAQMRRVISYVYRYLAQKQFGDVSEAHWRFSLSGLPMDTTKDAA